MERKAIPPSTCDYYMRMHLKSIEALSKYMAGGCKDGPLHGPMMVCVEMMNLRNMLDKALKEYSV